MWGRGLLKSLLKCSVVSPKVLVPTRITNSTKIPDILLTTKNSVVLVVDCISAQSRVVVGGAVKSTCEL